MNTFNLHFHDNHPILEVDGLKILVDTGSPATIHQSSSLDFCGESYSCSTQFMGLTISSISDLLGYPITTLLGADVFLNYQVLMDFRNSQVSFFKSELAFEGKQVTMDNFMGIPLIEFEVGAKKMKFFLDSGAKLSYLPETMTENYVSMGVVKDFYPGMGQFETDSFEIPTKLNEVVFPVRFGHLPALLQLTLQLASADGVMGYDFFNRFQVLLDFKNNTLRYQPYD